MKPIVFYIDDSEDALLLASMIVEGDERFTLIGLNSEKELTEVLENIKPSAAVVDLNLGNNTTGAMIATRLRKLYPNLSIAIYTSYEKDRIEKLILPVEKEIGKINVWEKSKIGVTNFADSVFELLKSA